MAERDSNHTHAEMLNHEQLQLLSGYEQPARIREWLESMGIPYLIGKGGRVCTTVMAVNKAFGITFNITYNSNLDTDEENIEIEAV